MHALAHLLAHDVDGGPARVLQQFADVELRVDGRAHGCGVMRDGGSDACTGTVMEWQGTREIDEKSMCRRVAAGVPWGGCAGPRARTCTIITMESRRSMSICIEQEAG